RQEESAEVGIAGGAPVTDNGRVAVVFGASGAIGSALTAALLSEQYHVVAAGRRMENLQALAARLRGTGCDLALLALDVTSDGSVRTSLRQVQERSSRLDAVVYAVGLPAETDVRLADYATEEWDATWRSYV